MKASTVLSLAVLAAVTVAAPASGQVIDPNVGLANPTNVLTFETPLLPPGTVITNQYTATSGITLAGGCEVSPDFDGTGIGIIVNAVDNLLNFDPNTFYYTGCSILFSTPVSAAAFAIVTNPGTTQLTALYQGNVVAQANDPTGIFGSSTGFIGFSGIGLFDTIIVDATNAPDGEFALDNIQYIIPGAVGDPQFTGFLGQSYQVHGTSETVYNIISTPSLQYNALFQYLNTGKCRKGTQCFSHPGNYFGAVGVQVKDESGAEVEVLIQAGTASAGLVLTINNQTIVPSEKEHLFGAYSISLPSAFEVQLSSTEFNIRVQNSDMFLNQDVSIGTGLMHQVAFYKQAEKRAADAAQLEELRNALPHGILGQTWSPKTYSNRWKHIEGHLFDYAVSDGVMGEEFKYNKF